MTTIQKIYRPGIALMLALFITAPGFANPNDSDPEAGLAIHGGDLAQKLGAEAAALSRSASEEIHSYFDALEKNQGDRLQGKPMGQSRVKLLQIERLGNQLQILGEPAGFDYERRRFELGFHVRVISPWSGLASSQKYIASIRLAVQRQTPARMKTLEKIQKLATEQKWQAAEDELNRLFDSLEVGICFLSDQERQQIYAPFGEVRSAVDTAMKRIRSQEAAQLLGQSRAQQTPDFASHVKAIGDATAAVAASGQADWGGEQVTGPQLVEKIGARWSEVHVASIRCRALDWAMQPLFQMAGANATRISPDPTSETLQRDYAQFSTSVVDSIVALIRADAARVSGDDVSKVYGEYLDTIAPLARQVADENAVQAWDAALLQLAAKSPEFAGEVQAYDAATRELLRWRARTAASMAQARSGEFETLDKHLYDATVSKSTYLGLFPEVADRQLAPRLLASAPSVLLTATPRLMGKPATAFDVVRVSPTSSAAIARYRVRTYANVPAGLDLSGEISALKSDLMMGDELPALTLATATSVHSAERGDLAAVGGEIVGHQLEGVITRFASLPPPASILVPLGVLPVEDIKQPLLPQMLMRFDVQPAWVQHEHFYADLQKVAAAPAGAAESAGAAE